MIETLRVLLVVEAIGLAALPLAVLATGRLAGGWSVAFAKPLGFLLLGWLVWLGGRAGIPNGAPLLAGGCAALALAGLALWPVARRREFDRRRWLGVEALGIVAFGAAALFNAFQPAVWGTEKPMDMALVATTIASPSYPPAEPWLAGAEVNYYYLGHLATGVVIRLAGVDWTVGYNLALAALFAMLVTGVFGLAAGLAGERRPRLAGAAAVVLTVLAGTVQGGLRVLGHDGPLERFDWFGPTRVIPGTINEFPLFSHLLGDLHAHVIALPITVVLLAIAVQLAVQGPPRGLVRRPVETAVTGVVLGTSYAVNAWTLPIVAVLFAAALVAWIRAGRQRIGAAAAHGVWVAGIAVLAVLPFAVEFEAAARGVGWVDRRAELAEFLADHAGLYGTLLWALAALFAVRLAAARHPERVVVWGTAAALVAIFLLAEVDLAGAGIVGGLLVVAGGAVLSRATAARERGLWLLVAGGLGCLLVGELVYVRDEFDDSELFRMNTVFKFGYHAWALLGLAGGVAVAVLPGRLPRVPVAAWLAVLAVLVGLGLTYTVAGSYARKNAFADTPSLDGMAWLERTAPGDPAAVRWIRENVPRGAVVLEAAGEDYSAFGHGRISAYSGRPTVLNWPGHQVQYHQDVGDREREVRVIYTAADAGQVRELLASHDVRYVVVGPLERTTYGDPGIVTELGERVFERDGTEVYAIPPEVVPPARDPAPAAPPVLGGD